MLTHFLPLPAVMHQTLTKPLLKDRVIIVGDVHGCIDEFKAILHKCSFDSKEDTLILVGDLINKGPKSAEVVKYARELNCFSVRGNHDEHVLLHALGLSDRPRPPYLDFLSDMSR